MKSKVFSVFDSKVEAYMRPFQALTKGQALRDITEAVNNQPDHPWYKHSSDFTLFEIAEYDDSTGRFEPYPTPLSLGNLIELKETDKQLSLAKGH